MKQDSKSYNMKQKTKTLVKNGQLHFSSGSMTMPDEAVTHYNDLITNSQEGLQFLDDNFGF